MIYFPELHYFFDTESFPTKKAVLVTATAVAQWATSYKAKLLEKTLLDDSAARQGPLPTGLTDRIQAVSDLVDWIQGDPQTQDTFLLFLSRGSEKTEETTELFDHHDDTCCWVLNLSEEEFSTLQDAWKSNGLPTDLFYPQGQDHQEKNRFYTPKQRQIRLV